MLLIIVISICFAEVRSSDSFERNIFVRITAHGKEELSIHSPCPTETTTFLRLTEDGEDIIMYNGKIPRPKQIKYYYRNSSVVFRNLSIEDSGTHIWECENFERNTFNVFIVDEEFEFPRNESDATVSLLPITTATAFQPNDSFGQSNVYTVIISVISGGFLVLSVLMSVCIACILISKKRRQIRSNKCHYESIARRTSISPDYEVIQQTSGIPESHGTENNNPSPTRSSYESAKLSSTAGHPRMHENVQHSKDSLNSPRSSTNEAYYVDILTDP